MSWHIVLSAYRVARTVFDEVEFASLKVLCGLLITLNGESVDKGCGVNFFVSGNFFPLCFHPEQLSKYLINQHEN